MRCRIWNNDFAMRRRDLGFESEGFGAQGLCLLMCLFQSVWGLGLQGWAQFFLTLNPKP